MPDTETAKASLLADLCARHCPDREIEAHSLTGMLSAVADAAADMELDGIDLAKMDRLQMQARAAIEEMVYLLALSVVGRARAAA